MKKKVFALLITGLLCHGTAAIAAAEYKIVTASARGTYIQHRARSRPVCCFLGRHRA